jgi:hypothetical protein
VKRYTALLADMEAAGYLEEDPDGKWVRWEDVEKRTEAEQAVLDAMAEVPDNNVRVIVNGSVNLRGLPKAFAAELARRKLAP